MKVHKFTIKRSDIDPLIHSLKALAKAHDNPNRTTRFVACNLLAAKRNKKVFGFIKVDDSVAVQVQIDREAGK